MQTSFNDYGLPEKLAHALARIKFTEPTPIQAETIPVALKGKDILGSAQTGTGKTGAFGIPLIAGLMNRPDATALVMTPTRELASQVIAALEPMIPTVDIRTALLIGGEAMPRQFHQLRHNPRLVVGTPGRINDHLERGTLKLGNVRYLVLDETDRMLDMGFGIQIERILKHVPDERQTLLFSATLPKNITKLSARYMKDPVRIAVGSTTAAHIKIKQEVIPVTDHEKYPKLIEQLNARQGTVIIFVKTKYGTEKLAKKLNTDGHRADAIHGDLQQRRRDRVIQGFRDKKFRILVATDVAARGLDIPHIAHVINYDMPQAPEDYIHRVGRTARAGAEGEAISFLSSGDHQKWRAIQRLMKGDDDIGDQKHQRSKQGHRGGRKPFWKKDRSHKSEQGSKYEKKSWGNKPRDEKHHDDKPHGEKRSGGNKPRDEKRHGEKPHGDKPKGTVHKPKEKSAHTPTSWGDKPRGDKPKGSSGKPHKPHKKPHRFGGGSDGHSFGRKPQRQG